MVLQDARLQMMAQQDPQAMQVLVNNMIAQKVVEHTAQLQQMEAQVNNQQQDPLIRLKQQEIDLRAMGSSA
jgi:hypothetical protein